MSAVGEFLGTWAFEPVPMVLTVLAGAAYLLAVHRIRHLCPTRSWPRRRTVSFLSGLLLLALVVVGPVGAYDGTFFWAHMVQHMAIMMVIAPLLLLGAPVLLLLQASSRQARHRWLVPVLRSRVVRWLSRPATTWAVFAATIIGTHFTPFYSYALGHEGFHSYVEHPLYLVAGLLYFYPLVGANPVPHGPSPLTKIVSLVLMMVPETMTGFFLYTAPRVLYPAYLTVDRPFGPGPLADQQLGGALMWCSGMVVDAVWIAVAVQAWLHSEASAGRRSDRRPAAQRVAGVA